MNYADTMHRSYLRSLPPHAQMHYSYLQAVGPEEEPDEPEPAPGEGFELPETEEERRIAEEMWRDIHEENERKRREGLQQHYGILTSGEKEYKASDASPMVEKPPLTPRSLVSPRHLKTQTILAPNVYKPIPMAPRSLHEILHGPMPGTPGAHPPVSPSIPTAEIAPGSWEMPNPNAPAAPVLPHLQSIHDELRTNGRLSPETHASLQALPPEQHFALNHVFQTAFNRAVHEGDTNLKSGYYVSPQTQQHLAALLGPQAANEQGLRAMLGIGEHGHIGATRSPGGEVKVAQHTPDMDLDFGIHQKNGKKIVHVGGAFSQRQGLKGGAGEFFGQIEAMQRAGVHKIETIAGRSARMIGYKVWPKYGFDARLPQQTRAQLPPELGQAKTVQDLYATPAGRKWWEENGKSMSMTLDLDPDSRSMQIFRDYRARSERVLQRAAQRRQEKMGREDYADEPTPAELPGQPAPSFADRHELLARKFNGGIDRIHVAHRQGKITPDDARKQALMHLERATAAVTGHAAREWSRLKQQALLQHGGTEAVQQLLAQVKERMQAARDHAHGVMRERAEHPALDVPREEREQGRAAVHDAFRLLANEPESGHRYIASFLQPQQRNMQFQETLKTAEALNRKLQRGLPLTPQDEQALVSLQAPGRYWSVLPTPQGLAVVAPHMRTSGEAHLLTPEGWAIHHKTPEGEWRKGWRPEDTPPVSYASEMHRSWAAATRYGWLDWLRGGAPDDDADAEYERRKRSGRFFEPDESEDDREAIEEAWRRMRDDRERRERAQHHYAGEVPADAPLPPGAAHNPRRLTTDPFEQLSGSHVHIEGGHYHTSPMTEPAFAVFRWTAHHPQTGQVLQRGRWVRDFTEAQRQATAHAQSQMAPPTAPSPASSQPALSARSPDEQELARRRAANKLTQQPGKYTPTQQRLDQGIGVIDELRAHNRLSDDTSERLQQELAAGRLAPQEERLINEQIGDHFNNVSKSPNIRSSFAITPRAGVELSRILGQQGSKESYLRDLFAVESDGHIHVGHYQQGGGANVIIKKPDLTQEFQVIEHNGKPAIHVDWAKSEGSGLKAGSAASGLGMFTKQIEAAAKAGIGTIHTLAAGNPRAPSNRMTGYKTWPKYGFDGPLPDAYKNFLPPELEQHQPQTIQELYAIPGGREWWEKNGGNIHVSFDLSPNSPSMQLFRYFVEEKQKLLERREQRRQARTPQAEQMMRSWERTALSYAERMHRSYREATRYTSEPSLSQRPTNAEVPPASFHLPHIEAPKSFVPHDPHDITESNAWSRARGGVVHHDLLANPGIGETRLKTKSANIVYHLPKQDAPGGVYKPMTGEDPDLRSNIKHGTYWRREVAASQLADHLGFGDLVPPTVAYKHPMHGVGSLQHYVGNGREAGDFGPAHRYDGPEDFARAAAFDFLTLNSDRHQGNWMLRHAPEGMKLTLIDNGLSFPSEHDNASEGTNSYIMHKAVGDRTPLPPQVATWDQHAGELERIMQHNGLSQKEIDLTLQRLHMLAGAAREGKTMQQLWRESGIKHRLFGDPQLAFNPISLEKPMTKTEKGEE